MVKLRMKTCPLIDYPLGLLVLSKDRVVTETIWLAKPEIFIIWPFTEKFVDPCSRGKRLMKVNTETDFENTESWRPEEEETG